MRNTFFVQIVLPVVTAGFCALYSICVPPGHPPTSQTLFARKLCGSVLSRSFNTEPVSWTARDPLPLPLLVTPKQLAHLRYLLSRPDARRVPEAPRVKESRDGRSERLGDPVASQDFSTSTSPSNHAPILAIIRNLSVPSINVNEQVADPSAAHLVAGVAVTLAHSPDNGRSNDSMECIQQSQGDASTLPVVGCAIQSTNSSAVNAEKATIYPAASKYIEALSPINSSHGAYQGNSRSLYDNTTVAAN
ncbi:hypothetical protein C0992_000480 [Termitomyces sp. T32_za158]|nr:hypothetical protein C0992_000480 [Termitomyces sp. T32_za158]